MQFDQYPCHWLVGDLKTQLAQRGYLAGRMAARLPGKGYPVAWGKVPACEFDGLMATGVVNDE